MDQAAEGHYGLMGIKERAKALIKWRISIGVCSGQRNNRDCEVSDKLGCLSFTNPDGRPGSEFWSS